jgi:hypothetical protein
MVHMVVQKAMKKRPRGRPPKSPAERLIPPRFVRLTRLTDAALEVYRQQRQRELGIPQDVSDTLRHIIEGFLREQKLLP